MGYVTKVGNVYYAQLAVPSDVQAALGKKLFRRSTGTGERRQAEKKAMEYIVGWLRQIDAVRGQWSGPVAELRAMGYIILTPEEAARRSDKEGELVPPHTPDEIQSNARWISEFERQNAERRFSAKRAAIQALGGYDVEAALVPMRAEIEQRLNHVDSIVAKVTGEAPPEKPADFRTVEDLAEQWKREKYPSRSAIYDADFAVKTFKSLFGSLPVESITRKHMAELLQAFKDIPKSVPSADRNMPVRDLILKYKDKPEHRADLKTAAKKMGIINAIFENALKAGIIEGNPAHGIKPPKDDQKKARPKARVPFSNDDIIKMFSGIYEKGEDFFWIFILALTSGARLNEIAQLRVKDVAVEDGFCCIHLHCDPDEYGPRSAKNASSIRKVPLRQEIAEAFDAFAKRKMEGLLFPDFQSKGGTSNKASKRVMGWVRQHIEDRRKVFHSFRHYLEDACRAAGVPKDMRYRITGHKDSDVGESYGLGYSIPAVAAAIANLKFPIPLAA